MRNVIIPIILAGSLTLAACGGESGQSKANKEADHSASVSTEYVTVAHSAVENGETVSSGVFSGRNDHIVTGGVSVVSKGDKTFLVLAEDFQRDGAPDPRLGFGNGEEFDLKTMSAKVDHEAGALIYELPSTVTTGDHDSVILWCNKFSVPLAVAPLG